MGKYDSVAIEIFKKYLNYLGHTLTCDDPSLLEGFRTLLDALISDFNGTVFTLPDLFPKDFWITLSASDTGLLAQWFKDEVISKGIKKCEDIGLKTPKPPIREIYEKI